MSNLVRLPFAQLIKSPFRRGQKEVYLPTFTITFIRSPLLPPTFASFLVPLNLNKLDLRDYLFHAYGIRIFSVRSFIKYSRVTENKPGKTHYRGRSLYRPKPTKKMTVEMDKPFVWPKEPEDLEPWSGEALKAAEAEQKVYQEREGRLKDAYVDIGERNAMREQARLLLSARTPRKPMMTT